MEIIQRNVRIVMRISRVYTRGAVLVFIGLTVWSYSGSATLSAQVPVESEVRQVVTFSFLPGKSSEALSIFSNQAIPLYEKNSAMLSFRGFREVESPVPLDLIVVSAFRGMAGMNASNSKLRALASDAGTSIGGIYGGIAALSSGHTDQFVEMLPPLGTTGDPSSRKLSAFVWYRILPGRTDAFEANLETVIVPWETSIKIPSATGRFLLSDGWHYLRILGFDSLGDYQDYWKLAGEAGHNRIDDVTVGRREVIVASVPELSVR